MTTDLDMFDIYRWLLSLVCTIYAIVVSWQSLWGWLSWFGSSRHAAVVGRYAAALLLRIRIRRHAWELAQIVVLSVLFCWIVYMHKHLEGV